MAFSIMSNKSAASAAAVATLERDRIKAILCSPNAVGLTKFAEHIAFKTDLSVAEANMLLAVASGPGTAPGVASATSGAASWSAVVDKLNKNAARHDRNFVIQN